VPPEEVLTWLLDSDPALRWQVERDLLGEPASVWETTRERVATEGFGAALLARQDADGRWAGGAYFPGDFDFNGPEAAPGAGQPWTATTWSLTTLREWGVPPEVLEDTAERIAASAVWEFEGLPYWGGEVDACINAMTLANGAWLGADVAAIANWFPARQMGDGGWNCEWVNGATVSSFHSTLNSLKGLLAYEQLSGSSDVLRIARRRGEEYLLTRRLHRRLTTDEPLTWAADFAYPFRWRYSVLNAVDYFRSSSLHDSRIPDPRLTEAIEIVRDARRPDGTWLQGRPLPGRVWVETDAGEGLPSKWLTFIATRALAWWDAARETKVTR